MALTHEVVSLDNLGRGAAVEKFDDCLQEVLDNIIDPNTGIETRSVTLKVSIKPNDKRTLCTVAIKCESKLASAKPFITEMFVGTDGNKAVATEHNPNQEEIPFNGKNKEEVKIYKLNKEGEK
jgi:hypothetical protein